MSLKKTPPIKRHAALQPLSREHHHGLLLAWKIRTGLSKEVPFGRIKAYSDWFFESHLRSHFEMEELHIFPILGDKEHPMVKRALREHRRLRRLFTATEGLGKHLSLIEEELTAHIRYEERVLFNEVQKVSPPEQLMEIEALHRG